VKTWPADNDIGRPQSLTGNLTRVTTSIVWLRDDLRIADHPALTAACDAGGEVVVVYILDEVSEGIRPLGSATKWWLHGSLENLAYRLDRLGARLVLRRGEAHDVLRDLIRETSATHLFWNRRYGLAERTLDATIKEYAKASGLEATSFGANLLHEPWTIRSGGGTPYTVFTPFWKACLNLPTPPRAPLPAPSAIPGFAGELASDDLDAWALRPTAPNWAMGFDYRWTVGEQGAHAALERFVAERLDDYAVGRDEPGKNTTSELSPHLRFGEISPFQIWARIEEVKQGASAETLKNASKFLAEVGWREFSYHLLFHWSDLATVNFDARFNSFAWAQPDPAVLRAWQQGETGIPLVDAGMRELWQTGYMHNRVRMVAASFLIKNLLIDWRVGEEWFWDTLVDADAASNAASWQWVAGSGADAAPYFRVFNPVLQAEKFDPNRTYLHRYLGDFELGELAGYPDPIVDLKETRDRALAAFAEVSGLPRAIRPPVEA
jgi:deoxyribodipyrimidine photo-lyase